MRVLMLGWEFPPFISGGLGTACYGLTRGLDRLGIEVLFVLPQVVRDVAEGPVRILSPRSVVYASAAVLDRRTGPHGEPQFERTQLAMVRAGAGIRPYDRPASTADRRIAKRGRDEQGVEIEWFEPASDAAPVFDQGLRVAELNSGPGAHYGGDLYGEIDRYANLVAAIAARQAFDLIHAHDWMTFPAAIITAIQSRRPLVVHVHSTEFDRSGQNVNQRIYDIERAGMQAATRVIAVSHFTRNLILRHYGVDPRKVEVVHNAVDEDNLNDGASLPPITRDEKIVLFLGRITMQKGPEYFLMAAKRVLEVMENVRFIMAGSGDMTRRMIELAAQLGIGHKVLFTGFLRGEDVTRVYRMADLYVMPSVSEPFGIAPLEAMSHDVPVLISKQSGVAEVVTHALKVDFWDVDEMANKIVAVLRHPPLQATLRLQGSIEVRRFNWVDTAAGCRKVYQRVLARSASAVA